MWLFYTSKYIEERTHHGLVACNTSTRAWSWCLNVSLTVGFPLLVPLGTVAPLVLPIRDTVEPRRSWSWEKYRINTNEFILNQGQLQACWPHIVHDMFSSSKKNILKICRKRKCATYVYINISTQNNMTTIC